MNSLIAINNGVPVLDAETAQKIVEFERMIKSIKEQEETLRMAVFSAMESNNVVKVETDDLTITYVAATDRETFNSKKFRKDHPDMYDEYVSMSPVKASIRIKVKE